MNFSSDNAYGADPLILSALSEAASGAVASYGDDPWTAELKRTFCALFEREVAVHPVVTGTAANALALATLCPQHGAVLCHAEAHIAVDECGAPEFFSHGAKLVPLEGENGKLTPDATERALEHFHRGFVHHVQPAVVSITQASEVGTVYTVAEIESLAATAKRHGLKLHMDGARFANALAHLACSPADATWRAGVDVMSFGGTKNGALCAEAVIFFDQADVRDFEYRRKKAGHLLSKMRFVSAQLAAQLRDGHWLSLARRANGLAGRLAEGLHKVPGARIAYPVDANAVFVRLPVETAAKLRDAGARFYDWAPPEDGLVLIRLVVSFATPESDVERFLELAYP